MYWDNNPFNDSNHFVDLGSYSITDATSLRVVTTNYDLYALVQPNGTIDFGAKYGANDEQYESGMAHKKQNGKWKFYVNRATAIAAARYFANHHYKTSYDELVSYLQRTDDGTADIDEVVDFVDRLMDSLKMGWEDKSIVLRTIAKRLDDAYWLSFLNDREID